MFVRVKTTPNSPRKSVQIVQSVRVGDKVKQKIVRYVGIAMDDYELEQLKMLAESIRVRLEAGVQEFLISPEEIAKLNIEAKKKKIQETDDDYKVNLKKVVEEQRIVRGIHDIYGTLFDELGYRYIFKNPARQASTVNTFRDIVLARIANPVSKRASVSMLEEDFGVTIGLNKVYKMMDNITDSVIDKLNEISYENTANLFGQKIDVIFFDATTIYFESFIEDDFREMGYSKDLKFNQSQILLALMVTKEGLPIGYKIFEGSKYEGHTLIPTLKEIRNKYNLDKVIFVADAGMMNEENINELEKEGFEYIVGCRLKNLPKKLQKKIITHNNYTQINEEYKIKKLKYNGKSLIVSYSSQRAAKDESDRVRAIEKLRKKILKSSNPKEYITNYGNKKYLRINGDASIEINEEKIKEDSKWDGLHGVVTNAKKLCNNDILKQYNNLWEVENAFRITKHDLKVRPVFHWVKRRIKAHMAISFCAYVLVKHLEYRAKLQYQKMSPEKIRRTLLRVQTSIVFDRKKKIRYGLPSKISQDARKIYNFMKIDYKLTPYIIKKM